jgi:membrane protein DedA with SNARE-associated domain
MSLETIISQFGYPALIAGLLLEGETVLLLNLIGAFLWSLFFGVTGYMFGQFMEVILMDVSKYEHWIFLTIVLAGTCFWFYRRYKPFDERDG